MRIIKIEEAPLVELPYLNASRGGSGFNEESLSVLVGTVDRLPKGVDALVVTSDLQGREHFQFQSGPTLRLLGEWLPKVLRESILPLIGQPVEKVGVLLCGDFYTVPNLDKRGGSGDVTSVWNEFGDHFTWVAGVAGNHDTFGASGSEPPKFRSHLHFLDCNRKTICGLDIAGISGIIGDPKRAWRKSAESFERFLHLLASRPCDILLMHDGPDVAEHGYNGTPSIREALKHLDRPLVIRGHTHWDQPMAELQNGLQVLNVDSRVVLLTPAAQAG
jgi:3',5'-cyclic-AMP phosphodiesterase